MEPKRASWSGHLAFVMAAAASAIGLGNLWRFPYLAAQYGGGTFIAIYLLLVVALGCPLMLTEIAIGRKTRQSQLTAFSCLKRGWGFVGVLATVIPVLILPYYCVIGGWVIKYLATYGAMAFLGAQPLGAEAADSAAFFNGFISDGLVPFGFAAAFVVLSATVIMMGVRKGIEKSNVVLMPALLVLALALAAYVVLLPGSGAGVSYYLIPSADALKGSDGAFSFAQLAKTILGAMGQMFYSGSLAMGIMITYGSYMRREDSIVTSVFRIEFFDTLIALIAGFMIIPIVFLFAQKTGTPVKEAMNVGPGLMFVTLPRVFAMFGAAGAWVGFVFFALVLFAALTSSISMYETCVAAACDVTRLGRRTATSLVGLVTVALASLSALGYGLWSSVTVCGMKFLDFFDFITNSFLMPIVCVATCVFVGWVLKPRQIVEEVKAAGGGFFGQRLYSLVVRYLAPLFVVAILVSEVCRAFGVGGWRI